MYKMLKAAYYWDIPFICKSSLWTHGPTEPMANRGLCPTVY